MTPEEVQALKEAADAAKSKLTAAAEKVKADAVASAKRITDLEQQLADAGGNAEAVAALKSIAEELIENANATASSLNPEPPSPNRSGGGRR